MGFFTEGSKWIKIGAIVMLVTLLLHMVSMGAPNWARSDDSVQRKENIGLWRYCTDTIGGGQKCDRFIDIIVGDWLKAAQSFSILALFTMIGSVAVLIILAFIPDFEEDTRLLMVAIAITGVSALFKLIEVGTMGATYQEYFKNKDPNVWGRVGELSWAFYVAVVTLFLNFCSVILLVMQMASGSKDDY